MRWSRWNGGTVESVQKQIVDASLSQSVSAALSLTATRAPYNSMREMMGATQALDIIKDV